MKIVRVAMHNHGSSDELLHPEASGQHLHKGFPIVPKQRRQIPRMVWVLCLSRIEMAAGIGEAVTDAAFSLMDVKRKEACFCPGQTGHLRLHKNAVTPLGEPDRPPYLRMLAAAPDMRHGFGISCLLHVTTPDQAMRQQAVLPVSELRN